MKKLMLELDALKVESFKTGVARNADGTVRGHSGADEISGNEWEWEEKEAVTAEPVSRWSCPLGCTDGCTRYTCASGGDICCA